MSMIGLWKSTTSSRISWNKWSPNRESSKWWAGSRIYWKHWSFWAARSIWFRNRLVSIWRLKDRPFPGFISSETKICWKSSEILNKLLRSKDISVKCLLVFPKWKPKTTIKTSLESLLRKMKHFPSIKKSPTTISKKSINGWNNWSIKCRHLWRFYWINL